MKKIFLIPLLFLSFLASAQKITIRTSIGGGGSVPAGLLDSINKKADTASFWTLDTAGKANGKVVYAKNITTRVLAFGPDTASGGGGSSDTAFNVSVLTDFPDDKNIAIIDDSLWWARDSADCRIWRNAVSDRIVTVCPEEGGEEGFANMPSPSHHAFMTSFASNVYEGGTGSDMEAGLCGTVLWQKKANTGDDVAIIFQLKTDAQNYTIGFSEWQAEQTSSYVEAGFFLGGGFWKPVDEGVRVGSFTALVNNRWVKVARESGVWKLYLSDDPEAWGSAVYTYTYTGSVTMYPVVQMVAGGKLYYPQQSGLVDNITTPAVVNWSYLTGGISEASNGLLHGAGDNWEFARTTETFTEGDYIEYRDGNGTMKNGRRVGFTNATSPSAQVTDFLIGANFDNAGSLHKILSGTLTTSSTYSVGDWIRVYASGNIKKSSDNGVTWTMTEFNVGKVSYLSGTVYGMGALYEGGSALTEIKKGK